MKKAAALVRQARETDGEKAIANYIHTSKGMNAGEIAYIAREACESGLIGRRDFESVLDGVRQGGFCLVAAFHILNVAAWEIMKPQQGRAKR